jgi:SAM-dependent methyltransferase
MRAASRLLPRVAARLGERERSGSMNSITIASDAAATSQQIELRSTASPVARAHALSAQDWSFERLSGCPVCQGVEASTVVAKKVRGFPLEFARCGSCSLIYQNPRLTRESLANYFSSSLFLQDPEGDKLHELLGYSDYFNWDRSYRRTAQLRLARLGRFKQPPGVLLEIGTATGSFLQAARSSGFRVRGLDLSTSFAKIARKNHALDIDVDYIEEAELPESYYDVVCNFGGIACWRDPLRALANIHNCLKADGIFVLNHFDVDSVPGRILEHRHFEYNHASLVIYSKKTMERCLKAARFEVLYSQNERQYASLGRIAGYLKQAGALKALRALGLQDAIIRIIVPGTIFVICRKSAS